MLGEVEPQDELIVICTNGSSDLDIEGFIPFPCLPCFPREATHVGEASRKVHYCLLWNFSSHGRSLLESNF